MAAHKPLEHKQLNNRLPENPKSQIHVPENPKSCPFGEVSEDTHALVAALATCRVRVAGVSRGRKGMMRTEEGERSLAISGLRRRLGVLTVKCQAHSLLGRLEVLGPGAAAAAGRRWQAAELERCWRKEERAHTLATAQGWRSYRTGFGKLD